MISRSFTCGNDCAKSAMSTTRCTQRKSKIICPDGRVTACHISSPHGPHAWNGTTPLHPLNETNLSAALIPTLFLPPFPTNTHIPHQSVHITSSFNARGLANSTLLVLEQH